MGSRLNAETETALAAVLRLCNNGTVAQEDFDALERHDEAALALLDVCEDEAIKTLKPLLTCFAKWAKPSTSSQTDAELWPTMTQPASTILSQTPSSTSSLPAHRALMTTLFRLMLTAGDNESAQGSPHRTPAPAAWLAARVYLLMLSLPGAGAYGILQPAVVGLVLTNLRSWCRNSTVYGAVGSGSGTNASAGAAGGGAATGAVRGSQKRRRGGAASENCEGGEGEESDGEGRAVARRRRGGGGGSGDVEEVLACLRLLKACVGSVTLISHQDLLVKLSEVLVGTSVVAAVNGPPSLAELASSCMVAMVMSGSSSSGGGSAGASSQAPVLQALMPVILMTSGKGDVPIRGKDCLKAHDYAVKITAAIATALKNARQQRQQRQGPQGLQSSSHSSNTNNSGTTETSPTSSKNSKPNANLEAGDKEISSPGRENASANKSNSDGDGVGKGQNDAGDQDDEGEEGKKSGSGEFRPVLTMLQHLCVAAPERAEGRARLASGIAALLPELEGSDRSRFVSFLSKFSRGQRILHRGFAVELSSRLVTQPWPWASPVDADESNACQGRSPVSSSYSPRSAAAAAAIDRPDAHGEGDVEGGDAGRASPDLMDGGACGGKVMLDLIVARAGDCAPTVRSKAAATLCELLTSVQRTQNQPSSGSGGSCREGLREAIMEAAGWGKGEGDPRPGSEGPLLAVVRARVEDEKANVRRNAVPALEALLALSPVLRAGSADEGDGSGSSLGEASGRDVEVEHANDFLLLEARCNDVSLSTRKAAMTALSSLLLSRPRDQHLQQAWVTALLPLAGDPEQTCQIRLVELVRTVLLDRVVDWHKAEIVGISKARGRGSARSNDAGAAGDAGKCPGSTKTDRIFSVWPLLAKAAHGDAHKCLKKVISILMSQKESGFKPGPVLNALRSAAVMALPPKAMSADEMDEGEDGADGAEEGEWDASDSKLLSLSESLPRANLTTIRRGTWTLLEAFLDRSTGGTGKGSPDMNMDPLFVVRCWSRIRGHILQEALAAGGDESGASPEAEEAFESDGRRILGVLARLAPSVPPEVATPLADKLLAMLLELVATPETSAAIVGALHKLCFAKAESEEDGAAMCNAWANHALATFEELLHVFVYQGSGALSDHAGARACGFDMARLVGRLLFAVGEVVVVGFTGKEDAAGPSDPQVPGAKNAADLTTVRPKASAQLIELVQVLLPPRLPTTAHGVEEGQEGPVTPPAVRALAFVTLGKLCLRDKDLAKTSVNILVRELDTADDPAVRSNALVVLGDLCVRYTAMVDRHVGGMAACLQDPDPLVRRHAILLISQLLLQDYVKWRGLLLYRFLATLVDADQSVKDLGFFTLTRPLINKNPGLFAQNFVEALFVLNNYSEHPCYAAAAAGRSESDGGVTMEGIDLGGDSPAQVGKRMALYSTMLEHMTDEQKITVTAKLSQEVLSAAVDGGLPIATYSPAPSSSAAAAAAAAKVKKKGSAHVAAASKTEGFNGGGGISSSKDSDLSARKKASAVVKDALTVLASSGIRVGGSRGGAAADLEDGSEEMASQQSGSGGLAAAKSKLLSKVSLKHLMEAVVPVMTALKHVLERAHSPLLRELMFYFREMFRSHKEEVTAVLASEAGLVDEIEFDLRRFEKEEQDKRAAREEAMAAAAAAMASSGMGPPRTPRGRRSIGGAGGTPGISRTPVAAVMLSARKTPYQNMGECSGVKLKGAAGMSVIGSPSLARGVGGGSRGPAPRTPLQLRTPREAVAAALGSPMAISPIHMRSMSVLPDTSRDKDNHNDGDNDKGKGGTAQQSVQTDRRASKTADIRLPSLEQRPAKKRRWEVSVPPPSGDDVVMDHDQEGSHADHESGEDGRGQEDEGQKENDPRVRNAPAMTMASREDRRAKGAKDKGKEKNREVKKPDRAKVTDSVKPTTRTSRSTKGAAERPQRRTTRSRRQQITE